LSDDSQRTVLDSPVEDRVQRRDRVECPAASVVIVTHNGLLFTRLCLESLLDDETVGFEVVVVDNASTDGTSAYLAAVAGRDRRVQVCLNPRNVGFAAATNQAVGQSRGDAVVFLNNDTLPLGAWLQRLFVHLGDRAIGLVGAVTNRAGNEAEITVPYRTYGELKRFVADRAIACTGGVFDLRTATLFCAAMRRDVWEKVGPLDERFEIGMFEDDDLAMRVRQAGLRVVCAEDVFVHHFGQASIGTLAATGEYGALFHANRQRWETKWAQTWTPYAKRERPQYDALVDRVRQLVCARVPAGATVLVITKGDEELLKFGERRGWHFPQGENGDYAGHHLADSEACIAELERLRARGAGFLVIPETSRWWLQHYRRFAEYLASNYGPLSDDGAPATVVAL
jgi:GT2 family glycosyltransferase